ncbi:hypothetical protein AURDEDRAFT_177189 [Auricularia subglabra TFB-10046 SS5]|uniref:Uncharacterized protein n=1 Tax=Auricularia subglabra (strain TFB-10046 / SS5) TaxID=717982 RepID=J0CTS3_AURST|nr:hypothetical protein AURDEDRAFT_177189 [Auricularia subglabra TFB-10046 SS5]
MRLPDRDLTGTAIGFRLRGSPPPSDLWHAFNCPTKKPLDTATTDVISSIWTHRGPV